MTDKLQRALLQQEAIHACWMCLEMFDSFVLQADHVQENAKLHMTASEISSKICDLYNQLVGEKNAE